jgi:hypothetical protein
VPCHPRCHRRIGGDTGIVDSSVPTIVRMGSAVNRDIRERLDAARRLDGAARGEPGLARPNQRRRWRRRWSWTACAPSHVTTVTVWGTGWPVSGGPDVEKSLLVGTGTSGCAPGVAVMEPADLRMREYLTQLRQLDRTAIRGVPIQ